MRQARRQRERMAVVCIVVLVVLLATTVAILAVASRRPAGPASTGTVAPRFASLAVPSAALHAASLFTLTDDGAPAPGGGPN